MGEWACQGAMHGGVMGWTAGVTQKGAPYPCLPHPAQAIIRPFADVIHTHILFKQLRFPWLRT